MKINIILIFVSLVSIYGCTSNNGIYNQEIIFNEENVQLFILPSGLDRNVNQISNEFKEGIEITDINVINSIYNQTHIEKIEMPFPPSLIGLFSIDGEIYSNFYLNEDFTQIHTSKGNFRIEKNNFFRYKDKFKQIRLSSVFIQNRKEAIRCREALKKNQFLLREGKSYTPFWIKFKGEVNLQMKSTLQNREIEEILIEELSSNLGKFDLLRMKFDDDIYTLKIACEKFEGKLPENYLIAEKYTCYTNIEIEVLGRDKGEISRFLDENNFIVAKVE